MHTVFLSSPFKKLRRLILPRITVVKWNQKVDSQNPTDCLTGFSDPNLQQVFRGHLNQK